MFHIQVFQLDAENTIEGQNNRNFQASKQKKGEAHASPFSSLHLGGRPRRSYLTINFWVVRAPFTTNVAV